MLKVLLFYTEYNKQLLEQLFWFRMVCGYYLFLKGFQTSVSGLIRLSVFRGDISAHMLLY